jgi:hypothetical protein
MVRTILTLGFVSLLGLFALGFVFKIFGALIALLVWVAVLAIKVAAIGAIAYVVVRVVSPATARRLRSNFSGESY